MGDHMQTDWHVVFWCVDNPDGEEYGEPNVIDHWSTYESEAEANAAYAEVIKRPDLHSAGVARMSANRTDWV